MYFPWSFFFWPLSLVFNPVAVPQQLLGDYEELSRKNTLFGLLVADNCQRFRFNTGVFF